MIVAKPRRFFLSERMETIHGPNGDVWVECEAVHPPSMKGRKVRLALDVEDVTALLLELRAAAIRARSKTLAR